MPPFASTTHVGLIQVLGPMGDKFASLERPSANTLLRVFGLIAAFVLFLAYTWSGATPVRISGVVQSAGTSSAGKLRGGTQQTALVLLNDGKLVPAYVASTSLVSPGDKVNVLKEHTLLGTFTYQIASKRRGDEP